ncbi:MAG: pyruvate kinase alpha/beta domain-containing protein [Candidatus Saccharimonadales bacterium]
MGNLTANIEVKKVILYTQENIPVAPVEDVIGSVSRPEQNAISAAAVSLAQQLKATAIIAETRSGVTAENIASHRPNLPIILLV